MHNSDRKRYPTLRPLVSANRRPLLRSLITGRPIRIGAVEPGISGAARAGPVTT